MSEQEYIYAIGHPHGYVKVGRSNNPTKRLQAHQVSCPYSLWIIAQFPVEDSDNVESELHEQLEGKHVRGEWFELDYDDYDMLADMVRMALSNRDFESIADFEKWQARKNEAVMG